MEMKSRETQFGHFITAWGLIFCVRFPSLQFRRRRGRRMRGYINIRNMKTRWETCSCSATPTSVNYSSYRWSCIRAVTREPSADCTRLLKAVILCVSEWEMPLADWTRNPETQGVGWGTEPGAEGVAGEAQTQEEGTTQSRDKNIPSFPSPQKFRLFCWFTAVCMFWILWMIMGSLELLGFPESSETATLSVTFQALEDEFTRKLQEQEVFFKMTGESECLNPSTQSRISKFYPIPSVHSTGFWEWILLPYLHPSSVSDLGFHSAVFILRKC